MVCGKLELTHLESAQPDTRLCKSKPDAEVVGDGSIILLVYLRLAVLLAHLTVMSLCLDDQQAWLLVNHYVANQIPIWTIAFEWNPPFPIQSYVVRKRILSEEIFEYRLSPVLLLQATRWMAEI